MIGQWLSHQALQGGLGFSDILIRPAAEKDVVALPRSEKILVILKSMGCLIEHFSCKLPLGYSALQHSKCNSIGSPLDTISTR
jgi:hypothetical protein